MYYKQSSFETYKTQNEQKNLSFCHVLFLIQKTNVEYIGMNATEVTVFPRMIHREIPTQIRTQWSHPTQIDTIGVVGGVI